jgi:uncharacterized membrane protein
MKLKTVYLVLCVLGVALPYWQLAPWLATNGLNLPLLVQELFTTRVGAFFGMDVVISAAALLVFAFVEGSRLGIVARWLPLLAVLAVGVSLGLPLFLYMRERKLEQDRASEHIRSLNSRLRASRASEDLKPTAGSDTRNG